MRKTVLILTALLSASINYIWSAESSEEDIKIVKDTPIVVPEVQPRSLIEESIYCIYNNGSLYFTFGVNMGEVEISVTNQTTGVISIGEYESVNSLVIVNVSTDSGLYLIQIVTENGDVYKGEYKL